MKSASLFVLCGLLGGACAAALLVLDSQGTSMSHLSPSASAPPLSSPSQKPAPRAFAAQLEEWRTQADPFVSSRIQTELQTRLETADLAAVVKSLSPSLLETPIGLDALSRWARRDRRAALRWLAMQKQATTFQIAAAVRDWITEKNLGEVNGYLASLSSSPWRTAILSALGTDAVVRQMPEEAIYLAKQMKPGEEQTRLYGIAVFQLAQWDPIAAANVVRELSDPSLQEALVPRVASGYAMLAPAEAAQWVLDSLPPGDSRDQGLQFVLQVWAQEYSRADAAAWVGRLSDTTLRAHAERALARAVRMSLPTEAFGVNEE